MTPGLEGVMMSLSTSRKCIQITIQTKEWTPWFKRDEFVIKKQRPSMTERISRSPASQVLSALVPPFLSTYQYVSPSLQARSYLYRLIRNH
jgi:hypothetical protein